MKSIHFHIIAFIAAILLIAECQPERSYIQDQDARLQFSLDTVYFDTIFTTVGTTTKLFKIYNPHKEFVKIDRINLAGGNTSVFRINVDGQSGINFENYDLAPEDSMYVFVEATLDPNNDPDILRIQDSIIFRTNGNLQDIDLVAWGQDVHMLRDSILDYSATWAADKPYLIIDGVLVDSHHTLTIEEGVKIYFHRDAGLYVDGSLVINGSLENPVVIQGDRLEREFIDDPGYPGQWFGIFLAPGSQNNVINYATLLNGTFGILADSVLSDNQPGLTISNTEINRMSYDGILAQRSTVKAWNNVIGDCGNSCVELLYEGSYEFNHCTLANYAQWQVNRDAPALYVANYYAYKDSSTNEVVVVSHDMEKAEFTNCIIHGSQNNEIDIERSPDGILDYKFVKVFSRLDREKYDYFNDPNFIAIINEDRVYFDSLHVSYELDSLSPAIDEGRLEYAYKNQVDKNGNSRLSDGAPDIGAFEFIKPE